MKRWHANIIISPLQTTSLQSELAKLRASLEHGEGGKQKLEYALFVSWQKYVTKRNKN